MGNTTGALNVSDCYRLPPSSGVFSKNVFDAWGYGGVAFLAAPVALTLATLLIFGEEIHYIFLKSNSKPLRNALLWILSSHGAIMVIALVGVFVPRAVVEVGFMYNIYEAYAIYKYYYLIIVFAGGTKPFVEKSSKEEIKPNVFPFPCFVCLPPIRNSARVGETVKWLILQYVIVTPFMGAVAVVMRADGEYYKPLSDISPSLYLAILSSISTIICMYGVKLLYKFTLLIEGMENTHSIKGKAACMQLTMFVVGFESLIFNILAQVGAFTCEYPLNFSSERRVIYNYCVVLQMFFISLLSRYFFRRNQDIQRQVVLHDDLTLAVDYSGAACLDHGVTLHSAGECDGIVIEGRQSYNGVGSSPAMIRYDRKRQHATFLSDNGNSSSEMDSNPSDGSENPIAKSEQKPARLPQSTLRLEASHGSQGPDSSRA